MEQNDREFMKIAISEAKKSKSEDEKIHPNVGGWPIQAWFWLEWGSQFVLLAQTNP